MNTRTVIVIALGTAVAGAAASWVASSMLHREKTTRLVRGIWTATRETASYVDPSRRAAMEAALGVAINRAAAANDAAWENIAL